MSIRPLAERLRPTSLDDYIGQTHLVGPNGIIRKMIESGRVNSFILWGPPGVGKTTLAKIIASQTESPFYTLSAVTSGVKDVRDILARNVLTGKEMLEMLRLKSICFLSVQYWKHRIGFQIWIIIF